MNRWLLLLCACSIAIASPLRVLAQEAGEDADDTSASLAASEDAATIEAREHFQKGVDFYAEGDLNAARVELERAYALQPTYRLLFNLGQVAYEQREYAAAERYFRDYLEQGGDEVSAERRAEVERELARLQDRVANVRIATNVAEAKLFVDGREVGRAPMTDSLRLSAGRRLLRAEAPGHAPVSREVDVVGGEDRSFELNFGAELSDIEVEGQPGVGAGPHPALWTGIATGVVALAAGGMALWTNADDREYDRELDRRTTRDELQDIEDRTKTKALITDILLGTAVAGAAVTVVLLLTVDTPGASSERAALEVGPGSVAVRGTF